MQLNQYTFLERVAKSKLPVFFTGMGTLDEVKDAFKILKNKLIIFQCTSNYPSLISSQT